MTKSGTKAKDGTKQGANKPESGKQNGIPLNTDTVNPPVEIIDHAKNSKRLETVTKNIRKEVGNIAKGYCKIGYELYKVREEKLYLSAKELYGQNFNNTVEYGEKVLGFQRSSVANYISICERFSVKKDGKPTAQLLPEYAGFSYGQLTLMLPLPAEKLPEITPDKTCAEIREIKKQAKIKSEVNVSGSGSSSKTGTDSGSSSDSESDKKSVAGDTDITGKKYILTTRDGDVWGYDILDDAQKSRYIFWWHYCWKLRSRSRVRSRS